MEFNPNIDRIFISNDALKITLSIPLLSTLQEQIDYPPKRMGRPPKLDADEVALFGRLLAAGIHIETIAESFGVSRNTAFRIQAKLKQN